MNKLSTQVVAFLVLAAVTLVGVVIVTNSDIDTDVKTADTSELELTAADDAIDFSVGYPNEWQVAPNTDGSGYLFTLREPVNGIPEAAQPQIEISLQGIAYADTLAAVRGDASITGVEEYTTINDRRTGIELSNTETIDGGALLETQIVVLDPIDRLAENPATENRTIIARLIAGANQIGDYRQTLDLMLASINIPAPIELAQTMENPAIGVTLNYPEGWTAAIEAAPNDNYIGITPSEDIGGTINVIYVSLTDPSTGQPITLNDLEQNVVNNLSATGTLVEPLTPFNASPYQGETVTFLTASPTGGESYLQLNFIQVSQADSLVALVEGTQEQITLLKPFTKAILRSVIFTGPAPQPSPEPTEAAPEPTPTEVPTETPTEEATPAAEETATEVPTEVPTAEGETATEVPTEAPTTEATPAN